MSNGEKALVYSKEVWIALITFVIANLVQYTGVEFPLTPEQIYFAGIAAMAIVRIAWTKSNIVSVLPKK